MNLTSAFLIPALAALAACPGAWAQRISFGVVGGASLTGDFRSLRYSFPWESATYTDASESGPRSAIVGPMAEVGLAGDWSLEVNALHRTLRYQWRSDFPGRQICGPREFCGAEVSTWQFPVLLKYRLPLGRLRPFAAAGPSFRTHSNPAGSRPSPYGITAGAGVEMGFGGFYIAPTLRYTRWGADGLPFQPTIRNQVEAMAEAGYRTDAASRRPFDRKVWLGLIAGLPLTNDFPPAAPDEPSYTGDAKRFADFRSAAGLMAEVEIGRGLSVEVNGLYRRLHFDNAPEVVVTWQIPVLARYTLDRAPVRPFLEAGPSFRTTGNLNSTAPAHVGATAGLGFDARWGRLRLTPTLRYTRWAADGRALVASQNLTKRDQVELLFGFSF